MTIISSSLPRFVKNICRKTIFPFKETVFKTPCNLIGFSTSPMANSKFEYVKTFEQEDIVLPNSWFVVRIDGRAFHTFAKKHEFERPNDRRGIELMNKAARICMIDFADIIISYGQSDEYSFIFRRESVIFDRRSAKILSTLTSKFAAAYVYHWPEYFPDKKLLYPPSFDGRIVLYPTDQNLRDYLSWRQVDCHINNLYNTTFWTLVLKGGMKNDEAVKRLSTTFASDKNEILFSEFGINYNNEPEMFKKGTIIYRLPYQKVNKRRSPPQNDSSPSSSQESIKNFDKNDLLKEVNCDIINDGFWIENPHLLAPLIHKNEALKA